MKPASSRAKGRRTQQLIRDTLLEAFPTLEPDDIKSTSMGAPGVDILLSPAARKLIPYQIESKGKAQSTVHNWYAQAKTHGPHEPLVIVKRDRDIPLAVVSLEHFIKLIKNQKGE